jgi:long-subunit acyl-CoA synthetase (AMP-forming)
MPETTLAARARLDAAVEGLTVPGAFQRTVASHPDVVALRWKDDGEWRELTYAQYAERVRRTALGMKRMLGLERGDTVNLVMRNIAPFHWIDMGAAHLGCTSVSVYNSLSPDQLAYVVGHSGARVAFVEGTFLEKFLKVRSELPALEKVVVVEGGSEFEGIEDVVALEEVEAAGGSASSAASADGRELERLSASVEPGDLCTLIYTSGTTGPPKGVMITHRNIVWTCASYFDWVEREPGWKVVSYLPMAHIAERMTSQYLGMWDAQTITCCPDTTLLAEYVSEERPETFFAVPRVWEKFYFALNNAMEAETDETRKSFILAALDAGREMVAYDQKQEEPPEDLVARHQQLDQLVLSQVRARLGLDRCQYAVSGAAPLSPKIVEFFHVIGLRIAEIYGMSESTGPASWNPPRGRIKIGTVGPEMPGIEIALAGDGEVMIRGGNVFAGYYRDDEKTKETLTPDGWILSGDIGELDEDRYLRIIDRKKELIITAGGKNIAPSNLENALKKQPIIGQCAVIGDNRPYVTALIVLDGESALSWAERQGIAARSVTELAQDPSVIAEVQRFVDDVNAGVSRVEAIKKFVILSEEWGPESDELTPTLKLKRRVVQEKYADLIDSMYT